MFRLIGLYSDYFKQENILKVNQPMEITKEHKEAVADLVMKKMVDARNIDIVIEAVSVLFESTNEADVFSLAMQKAGMTSPVMAASIANKLFDKKDAPINFITPTKIEGK